MPEVLEASSGRAERIAYYIEQNAFLNTLLYRSGIIDQYMKRVVHKRERLNPHERDVLSSLIRSLKIENCETRKPIIIALVGAVGSGKSTVARAIAGKTKMTIIEGDALRVALRKAGQPYDAQRMMTEEAALAVVARGGNVIVDGDFMPLPKRASLLAKAKEIGAKVIFVRTTCDYDVAVGRALTSEKQNEFFEGASSQWTGDKKAFVVKMRELWRRTPNHYEWANEVGGKWKLKNTRFKVAATIDTTDPATLQKQISSVVEIVRSN